MPEITLEDEIEAVRSALHLRDHWVAMNQPNSTIWLENKKRADALRSALARLEASRWRAIKEAGEGKMLIAYKDNAGNPVVAIGNNLATQERGGWFAVGDYYTKRVYPSHFMPLPPPPSTTSEGENLYRKVVDSDAGRALRESM